MKPALEQLAKFEGMNDERTKWTQVVFELLAASQGNLNACIDDPVGRNHADGACTVLVILAKRMGVWR